MCLFASHRVTPPLDTENILPTQKGHWVLWFYMLGGGYPLSYVQRDCQLGPFFCIDSRWERGKGSILGPILGLILQSESK
jgi:hypothetical protein